MALQKFESNKIPLAVTSQRATSLPIVKDYFFFFFFFDNPSSEAKFYSIITQKDDKESRVTRGAISSGEDLIQTCSSLLEIDFLARKWTTELPMWIEFFLVKIFITLMNREKSIF